MRGMAQRKLAQVAAVFVRLPASSGHTYLRWAQQFILPEIAATQLLNNGSLFMTFMPCHRHGFMCHRVEGRTHAFERVNVMHLQQRKKFSMDESHASHNGFLFIACPPQRFFDVVDNI